MMKNKNWRLIGLLAILAALIILLVKIRISEAPTTNSSTTDTTIESELMDYSEVNAVDLEDDGVIFATTEDNQNLYINTKYGFSFVYPEGWRTGDYSSESLQLMNYPEKDALHSNSVFGKGENKIEIGITTANLSSLSDDKEITIVSPSQTITKWTRGKISSGYLMSSENENIAITIFGDQNNWDILDELAKNFSWTKK